MTFGTLSYKKEARERMDKNLIKSHVRTLLERWEIKKKAGERELMKNQKWCLKDDFWNNERRKQKLEREWIRNW